MGRLGFSARKNPILQVVDNIILIKLIAAKIARFQKTCFIIEQRVKITIPHFANKTRHFTPVSLKT
jgi:hypothetical protein